MRRGRRCVRALGSEQVGSRAAQGRTVRRADSKWTHSVCTYLTLFGRFETSVSEPLALEPRPTCGDGSGGSGESQGVLWQGNRPESLAHSSRPIPTQCKSVAASSESKWTNTGNEVTR